ncbi:hypothetical protein DVG78_07110 [Runella aurantiaca]|uniref:Uncharacterized protein n=1 Tax=Runella aurantiaca TaxID=2282308 RepID=A0A369I9S7_9BACT|nr:hypothetical protein DVG78_07110 [Runella aurantiaca]
MGKKANCTALLRQDLSLLLVYVQLVENPAVYNHCGVFCAHYFRQAGDKTKAKKKIDVWVYYAFLHWHFWLWHTRLAFYDLTINIQIRQRI